MTEDDIREVFSQKIKAARWLEANGNSRDVHAAKMTRYALETSLTELLRLAEEPVYLHRPPLFAPHPTFLN